MPNKNPVDQILEMEEQGKDDADIIAELTNQGLNPEQISNALNQAKIKGAVSSKSRGRDSYPEEENQPNIPFSARGRESMEQSIMQSPSPSKDIPPPVYSPYEPSLQSQEQTYDYASSGIDTEAIEEIAEEIIGEKWNEAKSKISGIIEWKDYSNTRLSNIESKLKRIESLIDELQTALLGKVQRYEQNIKDLGTEMKSIQGAFSKVLSPLSSNVRELQKITDKLHKSKYPDKKEAKK